MGWHNLFEIKALAWPGIRAAVTHAAWRAEQVPLAAAGTAALAGRVLARSYLGERFEYLVDTRLGPVKGSGGLDDPWREGDAVSLTLDPACAALIEE